MRFVKATYHLETKTVEYEASNGTRLLKTAGTLNWRFNNPGNIMALPEASKQKGRIGAGTVYNPKKNTFVIFSSIEVGEREKCALLKRKYRDDTISSMMSQYAPEAAGNDPVTYANFISSESGVAKDKKISDLNDNEFDKVVNAISKKEGGLKPGTEKWVYVTNVTVSDGSRPVADVPFKVTLGSTTYQWKTDSYGKLRTIIHTKQGMTIVIKYTNSAGREDVVYSAIAGDETKNIVLTRNFSQFSAKTLVDNPKTEREKSIRKPIKYIVMSGDSLAKIAARYKTSTDEIAKNNNIKDVSKIFPGQHLTIYGVNTDDPSIYMVSPGDTLAKIAAQNGTTVDELARRNNIADLNKIYPGQPILISNDVEYSSSHPVSATDKQAPKPNLLVGSTSSKVQSVNSNIKVLESVGSKKSDKPIALLPHEQREAPWMQKAMAEAKLWGGLKEDKIGHNFHTLVNSKCKYTLTNTAWCASFVNYCFKETSYKISKGFAGSNSFVGDENFKKISLPIYGCLMVWRRNGKGHVAFVYGRDSISGEIIVLGGNQDDSINFMLESDTTKVLVGYYIPAAYSELNRGGLHVFDVVELNKSININYVRKSKGKNKIAIKDR